MRPLILLILTGTVHFLSAQGSPTLTLHSSPNPSTFGSPVTLTATVTPTSSTGRVTFYDGVVILGESSLASGHATLVTRLLGAGAHTLHAYYSGSKSPNTSQVVNSTAAGGFKPAVNYPAGMQPWLITAADINSDGKVDLAIAGHSGALSILLANGDGTFGAPVSTVIPPYCLAMVAGDFNDDGKPDLAISTSGQVAILIGNGDGTFQTGSPLAGGTYPVSLVVIDANGDGNADLAVLDAGTVDVFLGNGDGTFQRPATYTTPSSTSSYSLNQEMVAGDFNGDGNTDLVIAAAGPLALLFGNGDGSFQPAVNISLISLAYSVGVGDFNGDGKLDIVVGDASTGGAAVILGNGDGTVQTVLYSNENIYQFPTFAPPLITGDFNGDGKLDIAAADFGPYASDSTNGVTVGLGNGDGTFQRPLQYTTGPTATAAVVAADFNGDGRVDLAATSYWTNSVGILLGQTAVNPTISAVSATPYYGSGSSAIFTFQFSDSAGTSDIVAASASIGRSVNPAVSPVCAVTYNHQQNTLALWNDDGSIPAGIIPGSGQQQNTSCSLDGRGSSVVPSGNFLTLNLAIAFNYAYNGFKATFGNASSTTGATTGWRPLGTWTVAVPVPAPQAVTVTPSTGQGPGGTFTFLYSDSLGTSDLSSVQAIFQTSAGTPACALTVNPANGSVGLMNDANTSLLGPMALGANGTLQNSQCSVNLAASSGVASANSYALSATVTFKGGFNGAKSVVGYASSLHGTNSGLQTLGTWTVGPPAGPYLISSLAGGLGQSFGVPAASVEIPSPLMVATDGAGNVYFTAWQGSAAPTDSMRSVRLVGKVDTHGILTKLADSSQFFDPYGVATDSAGNVYVSDQEVIYKIAPTGWVSRVAGTGQYGYSGDNGPALNATFGGTYGLAVDRAGNVYIADGNNGCIRKVSTAGIITTIAGRGTLGYSGDHGPATAAQLNEPYAVAVDASGNIFVADTYNSRIRKISTAGVITTVAGTGAVGFNGDHIPATQANIGFPHAIALDPSGNLYVASAWDYRVRVVSPDGTITTIAGSGTPGYGGDGGPATSAALYGPFNGLAVDAAGNVYFPDAGRIRKVSNGIISTLAGGGMGDGGAVPFAGSLSTSFLATDAGGNVYLSSSANNRVRKVTPSGTISTVAGTGEFGNTGDGGLAVSARLAQPTGIAFDTSGNLFIANTSNHAVRKVSTTGTISTVAGAGFAGFSGDNGPATAASLNNPMGMTVDATGNLYIADSWNQVIRKVDVSGKITTYAGNGTAGFSGDNGPARAAQLNYPQGVAVDAAGNLFIADASNGRIRKVAADGTITTLTTYNGLGAIAADKFGSLYFADYTNAGIKVITPAGAISTIAGGGYGYESQGQPASGIELQLGGLAVDNDGKVYIGNYLWSSAIDVLTPENGPPVLTMSGAPNVWLSPGSSGQFTVTVTNALLAGSTGGTITVTDLVPPGLTINSMSGSGWTCTTNSCSRSDSLPGGGSYPIITVIVDVSVSVPAQVTNQVLVSGGGAATAGLLQFAQVNRLIVNQIDNGPFLQGGTGTYTVTVGNSWTSSVSTGGTVTLTETLPPGFTLVGMSGPNWTCPAGGTGCTRNDALYPAGNYDPVTVTVKVAADASSPVVNLVSVSSSGFLGASATHTTPVLARCNVTSDTMTSVFDVQRIVKEALGLVSAVDDLNADGTVNVADTQVVANAALHLGCTL